MAIFKRIRHPLPKFPGNVRQTFKRLKSLVTPEELKELRVAVEHALADLEEKQASSTTINLEEARKIAKCCFYLIDHYDSCESDKLKSEIVAAVRYFALAEDPFDEMTFAGGLHDDKMVLNHVLEKLGLDDWILDDS